MLGARDDARARSGSRARRSTTPSTCSHDCDEVAVVARSQSREPFEWTFRELRDAGRRRARGLQRLGVEPGDRVVAYLPNIPETLVAFLATASLGAIWASVSPEFGPRSVIDRFAQIEPKVLRRGRRLHAPRQARSTAREEVAAIRAGLPTLEHTIAARAGRARRRARVRAGAVRPPAVRALLSRHDRAAEADRPRPRRHPARAPQEPRADAGTSSRATGCCSPRRPPG